MNAIPLINNIPKTNINNEKQLRQEINTSLVALKKEAGTLEGLINEAAQMLVTINNRIATLENDTVKKSDIVDVVQSGNLQPVTSNAVATSNAMPVDTVTSGNMHSVTSGAVAEYANKVIKYNEVRIDNVTIDSAGWTDMRSYFPSGMNNFMFCLLYTFGTNWGAHSFDINADGRYMRGTPNDTIDYVILRYYYTD